MSKKHWEKRQRNVKITSHNHNQHLLLYITAEQLSSGLGNFRVPKVVYISCNMSTWDLPDICAYAFRTCSSLVLHIS